MAGGREKTGPVSRKVVLPVAVAASLGSLVDYYDFFLAGFVAGAIWPTLFFPSKVAAVAVASSIAAYGVSYLTRPIGAFLFGNYGDRSGRKSTLIWTLLTAGVAMVGIALVPPYASIGLLAPTLVVLFRLLFGLGIGGEWGGASSWVIEHAYDSKWRAFWASWVQGGAPAGRLVAGLAFAYTSTLLPRPELESIGWRVLFVVGAIVLVVAIVMRYLLSESPLFNELRKERGVERFPASKVLKDSWGKVLKLALAVNYNVSISTIAVLPFTITLVEALGRQHHLTTLELYRLSTFTSLAISLGALSDLIFQAVGGVVSSVIGRKSTLLVSIALSVVAIYPYFLMVITLNPALILVASVLLQSAFGLGYGGVPAFLTESFQTKYRYSGSGLSYQLGSLISGVAGGFVVPAIVLLSPTVTTRWVYVGALAMILTVFSLVAVLMTTETKDVKL